MYHSIIRSQLLKIFDELNKGNYEPILNGFAPRFEHCFYGKHALGGARHTLKETRRWYERLQRVLPGLIFEIKNVNVKGWPWNTIAAVEWSDSGTTLDGKPFRNQGVHFVNIRFGKVTSLRIYCDTQVLQDVLQRNAAQGLEEAAADPIVD
ncbi:nuclear transport factor 2 family protein [Paenibacillus zanthoxyli]|uniref:nuclear transport factor 2 family protein n=1 Tax=Paenibacillus zanthoxyli TaxID=369399 RepID=UPI000470F7CC|nr:nuclear transport factor 2 family protein [Paenibacillus zanthoxyli]